MTGHLDRIAWHTCQHCGKCHYDPTVWHLGHTPTAVRRGYATRDDISTPRKRDTA